MNLLLDQGIPYSASKYLQKFGYNVFHTVDLNMQKATDREIILYAKYHSCICVTLDSDFHSIIALDGEATPSVIRIRIEGLDGKKIADLLHKIIDKINIQLDKGCLVTVNENAFRIRALPVNKPKM